jgi:hypothetical protein
MLPLRKAKVCDLDIAHKVKQKVLWLEVTENYAAPMLRSQQSTGRVQNLHQNSIRKQEAQGAAHCQISCSSYCQGGSYSDQAWLTM